MEGVVTKVAIVPFNLRNQVMREEDKELFVDPEIKYLKELDESLKNTLYESGSTPEQKYKKYVETLNKYGTVMKNVTKPIEIKINEISANVPQQQNQVNQNDQQNNQNNLRIENSHQPGPSNTNNQTQISNKINESLNKMKSTERGKALQILNALENDSNIRWNNNGELYFQNKIIPGSNINDTLNDFMNRRKTTHPGFTEIALSLHRNKFPIININNQDQLRKIIRNSGKRSVTDVMDRYKEEADDEDGFTTSNEVIEDEDEDENDSDEDDDDNKTIGEESLASYKQIS
jgi:hypothetical protein